MPDAGSANPGEANGRTAAGGDFTTVTEHPGVRVTAGAIERLRARYAFAGNWARGKRLLEVACGAGAGLGYLAARTRLAIGGDVDHTLLAQARCANGPRIPLLRLDAEKLPFRSAAFDVVVLHEALYYVDAARFLAETHRVLDRTGVLVMCSVNPAWHGFHPSPLSRSYYSAAELRRLLRQQFDRVEVRGGCSERGGVLGGAVRLLRRAASGLDLVPGTMKRKELLKRVFYGPLQPFPAALDTASDIAQPMLEPPEARHIVLFAVAWCQ